MPKKRYLNSRSKIDMSLPSFGVYTTMLLYECYGNLNSRAFYDMRWSDHNNSSQGGRTPLHEAAWFNSRDVAELLIRSGAYVNAKDEVLLLIQYI